MTKKDKILLIQDLCSRLPYGVSVKHVPTGSISKLNGIKLFQWYNDTNFVQDLTGEINFFGDDFANIEDFKPMLRPSSDLTEEELNELDKYTEVEWEKTFKLIENNNDKDEQKAKKLLMITEFKDLSFLYSHHIDICGLIPKNLAIQVSKDYYFD